MSRPLKPLPTWVVVVGSLCAVPAHGAEFVTADGRDFTVNGQLFRFLGYNLRGACHYGYNDALPQSTGIDLSVNLNYAVATKARVVRVYCSFNGIGQVETGNRLAVVLDACAARGLWAIVVLTDVYDVTRMHPQGDTQYFTLTGCCGLKLYAHTWYQSGYKNYYLPQALYLANRFKDHPAVFAWQLGNEIRDIGNGATFLAFCQDVVGKLRTADPNHMISLGLIWASHAETNPIGLYTLFDFVGSHNYNGGGADDTWIAVQLDKPYVVDEAGFDSNVYGPDRTPENHADIDKWINQRGASGYMNWALMATPYANGDGDNTYGIDNVVSSHKIDFVAYGDLYRLWGTSFAPVSQVQVSPAQISRTLIIGEPASDNLLVTGTGDTPFSFTVQENASWLSAAPTEAQATPTGMPIELTYDASGLTPGIHQTAVTINAVFIANSPLVVNVTVNVLTRFGDFDLDQDLDQSDFGRMQACLSSPDVPPPDPECMLGNFDGDDDVDQTDIIMFRACMLGPGVPVDIPCPN